MTATNPAVGKLISWNGRTVRSISVTELRRNLSAILDGVEQGERFLVTRYRKPVAWLVPIEAAPPELDSASAK